MNLTRWNRAGLSRFRYIDGNAVTYLETLRQAMSDAFTDAGGTLKWTALRDANPVLPDENLRQRHERLQAQYNAERRDHGWEILRALARSGHVLGEYIDAYANESSLRTATQWDNLRRLVEMLDYHPAPPASSETPIALLVKEAGTVEAGFAVKNKPSGGDPAVVFETLADLAVDPALNILYPPDRNSSREPLTETNDGTAYRAEFPVETQDLEVSAGDRGLLIVQRDDDPQVAIAVKVDSVGDDILTLVGDPAPSSWPSAPLRSELRLLLQPQLRQAPYLTGSDVLVLESGHALTARMRIAWYDSTWKAATVSTVEGDRVRLDGSDMPSIGDDLYAMAESRAQELVYDNTEAYRVILPHRDTLKSSTPLFDRDLAIIDESGDNVQPYTPPEATRVAYEYLEGIDFGVAWYIPATDPLAKVADVDPDDLVLGGAPNLAGGDWVLLETAAGFQSTLIEEIETGGDSVALTTDPAGSSVDLIHGDFALELLPADQDINATPAFDTASQSDQGSVLPLDLDQIPELLTPGRRLLVVGTGDAVAVTLKSVDPAARSITVTPAIPEDVGVFTRHATTIHANVVQTGHGETKPERILGGGDATRSNQSFDLEVADISHVTEAIFASGVRAALVLRVDGREWTQSATLADAGPTDPMFSARMLEDGTLRLLFGDGEHGRRLPTGGNNLRVTYRVGSGLTGNLGADELVKPAKSHPLVDGFLQPIAATGGNDMEGIESLRENAPASLLTLERAVSLSDFAHLAATNSSVWQARAFARPSDGGRGERIEVTVVPAGGGPLEGLGDQIATTLLAHALPGVEVTVSGYGAVIPQLEVEVTVKPDEYQPEVVVEAVRDALTSAFSLAGARLGEPLFRSRLFAVVEAVTGVESSRCHILADGFRDQDGNPTTPKQVVTGADGEVRRVSIEPGQAIYLDTDISLPVVTSVDFTL